MSVSNYSNRPQASEFLSFDATATVGVLHAHKKMVLKEIRMHYLGAAVAADATNFQEFQFKRRRGSDDTDVGEELSTAGAVAANEILEALAQGSDVELERGDTLVLTNTKNGTGTLGTVLVSVDYEVVGN